MTARTPQRQQLIELIAYRFRVLSEPTRIRLLGLLDRGEASVQELTDQLQTTHQNVSKHLGILFMSALPIDKSGLISSADIRSLSSSRIVNLARPAP